MVKLEAISEKTNFQEKFCYRQVGSATWQIDPVDVSSSLEYVMAQFNSSPDLPAIPVERNGALIGILERSHVEKMTESAWARFWQKDLDAYITAPLLSLRADDYIEKHIVRGMQLNNEQGIRYFAVYYRRSFFGIAGLHQMLERMTELRTQDLAKAYAVQRHLLESNCAQPDPRFSLITWNRMANEVGGDFYKDFSLAGGDRHIIGCFDVSGKNVAASLSTMAIGSFFTALALCDTGSRSFGELTSLMDAYVQNLTPSDVFITAALCYVDAAKGSLFIQNCGHTPVYLFVPGENRKIVGKTLTANLPPLGMGIVGGEEATGYRVPIVPGLRVVMYTDGLTDMLTPDGERYEDERTRQLFVTTCGKSPDETNAAYEKAVQHWAGDAMLPDDITIMDLRFT